jgi:CzcA family heavy metal efflux pump
MLKALVEFSIRFRGVVIALACLALGYGIYMTLHAKLDVFPEFAPPLVVVQTEAPGLSPEEVEMLITRPIEIAINGTGNLDSLRSQSIQGISVVTAIFSQGTDVYRARQLVAERLGEIAGQLPQGTGPPIMTPLTSATSTILDVGLTSEKISLMDLRTFADWTVRQRLLAVPGVASVVIFGGDERQLQIQLKPDRLLAYGVSVQDVLAAARNSTGIRGAGFIDTRNQRIVLRSEGQSLMAEELGEAVIKQKQGLSVRLKDLASVVAAPAPKVGDALIQGHRGVILVVSSQLGANTMVVTQAVERALDELKPTFQAQGIAVYPALFRPANFITTAIHNVRTSLLIGAFLVAGVLFLFLFNVRTAFISISAIPLSLLIAVIVLTHFGITLNTLTLGGLAIAIGEVVDDAIIDVENIFRRLRENRASGNPRSAFRVVFDASIEVRSAVIYATFVVALVFLPVITMSGVQGRLFAPLGIAYILAILASLAVALTVTPALSYTLLARAPLRDFEPGFISSLKGRYGSLLTAVEARPKLIMGIALALVIAAVATLPFFGGSFLPEFKEGHFIVHMSAVPGTSLEESLHLGREVTSVLLKNPHVRSVAQRVGRAPQSTDTWGTHYSEFEVDLKPLKGEEAEFAQAEIRDALVRFPGVYFAVKTFLSERIEETISGITAQVVVEIFGDDLDVLDQKAREVSRIISSVPGAADVQVQSPPGTPEMVIRLRRDRLKELGFQPVEVLDVVQTAYQGSIVSQTFQQNRIFGVAVILNPASRRAPDTIGTLMVQNSAGRRVPLSQLAAIYASTGRYAVLHDATRRYQAVTCNVSGRALSSFVTEARDRIAKETTFPAGVYPVFTGAAEAKAQAQREIFLYSIVAGVGIVLLLAIVFRSWRNLLLVLTNLPFALVGGVLAVFFTGGMLSLGSLVGFVTLFGITTRNSIMMLSHYEHLVEVEGMTWGLEAALRGASERLLPILMTALVTGLGLLPLAIGSGQPGREIEGPMAIVILGGLATSTTLNLLVLPTLALRYGKFERAELA